MEERRPKLRSDLIVTRRGEGSETWFVVKDPVNRRFFRFRRGEYALARLCDGERTLDALRTIGVDYGLVSEQIDAFIERLDRMVLLEGASIQSDQPSQRETSLFGGLLRIRLKAIDPDRLFSRLQSYAGPFFSRGFFWGSFGLILVAVAITLANSEVFGTALAELFRLRSFIPAYLVILAIMALHEVAHGMTCKHFGGEVHELGLMLLYLQPCLYCDVSDAWLFAEKHKRLAVTFAGIYFQLVLWGLATVCWRILAPDTLVNQICLVVMTLMGIGALLNLNPLIRLDGYYLLSDALEIPNLRRHTFGYLKTRLQGLVGLPLGVQRYTSRERRIFLFYGLLAGCYSVGLLGYMLFKVSRILVTSYQTAGLVLAIVLVLTVVAGPTKKGVKAVGTAVKQNRERLTRWSTLSKIGGIVVLFLLLLFGLKLDLRISAEATLIAGERVVVRAPVAGLIASIHVDEGDWLKAGDLIARLDTRDLLAEREMVKAEVAQVEARLRLLRNGPRPEEIEQLRQRLAQAAVERGIADSTYQRVVALYEQNLVATQELEQAAAGRVLCQSNWEQVRADLALLEAGSRPEEIEAVAADRQRLLAHLDHLNEQIHLTQIVSPMAGVVTSRYLHQRVREYVVKGDSLCEVVDPATLRVEILLPEKEIEEVQSGQRVELKVRGFPHYTFTGEVRAVAPMVIQNGNQNVVMVHSQLVNSEGLLKPGMTGYARISCGPRPLVHLLLRRLIRYIRVEFWWW